MTTDQHLASLQPAADARLLFSLTWFNDKHQVQLTVVPDEHTELTGDGPVRVLRLGDGTPLAVNRHDLVSVEPESLVYDMAHLLIKTSTSAVRGVNQTLSSRRRTVLNKSELIDLALRISQLYLVLLEVRLALELPAIVAESATQHHRLSLPEVLIAHYPEDETMPLADRDEFLDRFIEQHDVLVRGVDAYQRGFSGRRDEHRDVFWFFLREVAGFNSVDDETTRELASVLHSRLQDLDFEGYLKELTSSTPLAAPAEPSLS